MNVKPSFPAPRAVRACASGRMANTVHMTAMPASSDAELLPNAVVKVVSVKVSFFRR